ncbi:hypothetical protein HHI36_017056 [Cryptolaemus montrouzieri]|uniref:Uncharacterized protein n=1 Tax=Cryptolaemus montrouzieri TaxID=559131 RepID=A0ABD2NLQ5_9CUCU
MTEKKSSLCWLVETNKTKLSSDKLLRVRRSQGNMEETSNRKKINRKTDKKRYNKERIQISSSDDDLKGNARKINLKLEKYYAVFYDDGWFTGRNVQVGEYFKLKFLK